MHKLLLEQTNSKTNKHPQTKKLRTPGCIYLETESFSNQMKVNSYMCLFQSLLINLGAWEFYICIFLTEQLQKWRPRVTALQNCNLKNTELQYLLVLLR